jgi:2-keto-4-pentenoate hydratase/2-oxohepta-3-ene-1,7-dioic acid hydratase in catechol pathway
MKYARFSIDGVIFQGLVEGDKIRVITGNIFEQSHTTETTYDLSAVKLLAPVLPTKVVGVGLNYKSVAIAKGVAFPEAPILFLKPPSGVVGPGEAIVIPDKVKQAAFEVEVAVIIGRKAKDVPAYQALEYVFGYTLANDVTAKDHMLKGQPWARGKSFDTFTPLGPYLVVGVDPENIDLGAVVNGESKQSGNTSDMVFSIKEQIAFISGIMTLEPGDVILTGTPPGAELFSKGDVITLSSSQLGMMENPVA